MNIELDVLIETYSVLKQYIPQKDRQEASDNLMSVLVDILDDNSLHEFGSTDGYTKKSVDAYADELDDESYYDE